MRIKDLMPGAIQAESREFDWSEGYGDIWDVLQPPGVDDPQHEDWQEPMMNYVWPIPATYFNQQAARQLLHLPVCIVQMSDGAYGLALTGGGMDLSWELAEAYVLLGYLPPVALLPLPNFAGERLTRRKRSVLAAMTESCRVLERRAKAKREGLKHLRRELATRG